VAAALQMGFGRQPYCVEAQHSCAVRWVGWLGSAVARGIEGQVLLYNMVLC
jgi:hypothetical protein